MDNNHKKKRRYLSKQDLDDSLKRDKAVLNSIEYPDVRDPPVLTRDAIIHFTCYCGEKGKRGFRNLVEIEYGAYCEGCAFKKELEKRAVTMQNKFPVINSIEDYNNSAKLPDGYWHDKTNARRCMELLKSKMNWTTDEEWYKLDLATLQMYCGGLSHIYNDSPQRLLKAIYPEIEFLPWKFTRSGKNYWGVGGSFVSTNVNKEHAKFFLEWLVKNRGMDITNYENYYKITGKLITDAGGYGLLKYTKESVIDLLQIVFPEYEWLPWRFVKIPNSFHWEDIQHCKLWCEWVYEQNNFTSMEDWYKASVDFIFANCGRGLIWRYSGARIYNMLKTIYPEIQWEKSKFACHKTEAIVLKFLSPFIPDIIHGFTIDSCKIKRPLPFDFCSLELKCIIEVDGPQHFKDVWKMKKNIPRDIYKMRKAEEEGYKVIRIFQEDVYNNDEAWLEKWLLPEIQSVEREPVFICTSNSTLYDEHIKLYQSAEDVDLSESDDN